MVPNLLSNRFFDVVAWNFFQFISEDVIFLELMPIFFSLVEDNGVFEVKNTRIVSSELVAHDTLIDNDLLLQLAVALVVVELKSLYKFVFVIGVVFERFYDGHASLLGLNNVHAQVLYVVLVIFRNQIRLYNNCSLVVSLVATCVILSRKVEEVSLWIFLLLLNS